ncbi:hypothetical protein HN51_066043 [Arachis hypogaea]
MVKVQMNTADVAVEVKCLCRLIGMCCSNVYDLTPKMYVFKLMNSSGVSKSGESEKVLLLMESGVRLHTTVYMCDKSNTPSGFTLKLRKHIRSRRPEDIILFQFGLGENANYVILELYAQGNILLTDANFTILTLLRSHRLILVLVPNIKSFLPLDMYMVGVYDKRRICQDLRKQIRVPVEDKDTVIHEGDFYCIVSFGLHGLPVAREVQPIKGKIEYSAPSICHVVLIYETSALEGSHALVLEME